MAVVDSRQSEAARFSLSAPRLGSATLRPARYGQTPPKHVPGASAVREWETHSASAPSHDAYFLAVSAAVSRVPWSRRSLELDSPRSEPSWEVLAPRRDGSRRRSRPAGNTGLRSAR